MKTKQTLISVAALSIGLLAASGVNASSITVYVDGRSGPWDIAANPSFSYGVFANGVADSHLAPTSVSNASGLQFVAGNSLSIQYVSGSANAGGGGIYNDANGATWWPADSGAPGQYIAGDNYLEQLVGVFANSGGVIVGSPFTIGNGPVLVVIPNGSTQLLMGFNDGWYNDNGAGLYMNVTEVPSAVPVPAAAWLLGSGLLGLIGVARRKTA